jgi:hypothetical protein
MATAASAVGSTRNFCNLRMSVIADFAVSTVPCEIHSGGVTPAAASQTPVQRVPIFGIFTRLVQLWVSDYMQQVGRCLSQESPKLAGLQAT